MSGTGGDLPEVPTLVTALTEPGAEPRDLSSFHFTKPSSSPQWVNNFDFQGKGKINEGLLIVFVVIQYYDFGA